MPAAPAPAQDRQNEHKKTDSERRQASKAGADEAEQARIRGGPNRQVFVANHARAHTTQPPREHA